MPFNECLSLIFLTTFKFNLVIVKLSLSSSRKESSQVEFELLKNIKFILNQVEFGSLNLSLVN